MTVRVDEETTVTLVTVAAVVRTAADALCRCLLAPNCLHRMAVLALAPVDDAAAPPPAADRPVDPAAGPPAGPVPGASADAAADPSADVGAAAAGGPAAPALDGAARAMAARSELTARQRIAADGLWQVAVDALAAGTVGCGVVLRTALLRAVHEARANGLHRAAASGTRVAARLRAARAAEPQYRLADLTDDLCELLAVSRRLRGDRPPAGELGPLLGTARRAYDPQAGLRLYGLCAVPVVTDSGYAGVVTYLVDRTGRVWTVADLAPGDVARAAGAGDATVAVGERGSATGSSPGPGWWCPAARRRSRGNWAPAGRSARRGPPASAGSTSPSPGSGRSPCPTRYDGPSAR